MAKQTTKPEAPAAGPIPTAFYVEDVLAPLGGKRTHEFMLDGRLTNITFLHGERMLIPNEIVARYMLNNDGFRVTDAENQEYRARSTSLDEQRVFLANDEIVAKLSWLKRSALAIYAEGKGVAVGKDDKEADIITKILAQPVVSDDAYLIEDDDDDLIGSSGNIPPATDAAV
jgi:hypothetical protein